MATGWEVTERDGLLCLRQTAESAAWIRMMDAVDRVPLDDVAQDRFWGRYFAQSDVERRAAAAEYLTRKWRERGARHG